MIGIEPEQDLTHYIQREVVRLAKRYKVQKVMEARAFSRPPYTMITIKDEIGNKGIGFSKCSPRDQYDDCIGLSIAIGRAVRDLAAVHPSRP